MDDMIYRNNSIAEENIDPNGRPAENKFEEWSEEVSERTDPVSYTHLHAFVRRQRIAFQHFPVAIAYH